MSNRTSRRLHLGHPVAHVAFPMVRKTGSTPHRAAPTKKDQPERRACRGGLKQLSEHRRTPDPGEHVPAIAEEHARIDQRGARELVGCLAARASPQVPPKSCSTKWADIRHYQCNGPNVGGDRARNGLP